MPRMLRNVSCWPANDASGRSSAVAEDRTAKLASSSAPSRPSEIVAYASRTSCSNAGCNGCSTIAVRTCWPTRERASTSSVSSPSMRPVIRAASPSWDTKSRNAEAVVAKPSGTRTPAEARLPIISPSDEFFPPTSSRSAIPNDENHLTFALTSPLLWVPLRRPGGPPAGSGRSTWTSPRPTSSSS